LQLLDHRRLGLSGQPLLLILAHADQRLHAGGQHRLGLGAHQRIILALLPAPFGMADDGEMRARNRPASRPTPPR
jgi:hypothetical protein